MEGERLESDGRGGDDDLDGAGGRKTREQLMEIERSFSDGKVHFPVAHDISFCHELIIAQNYRKGYLSLFCVAEEDMLQLGENRLDFGEVEEITSDKVGDKGDERNHTEFGEGGEEGVVGGEEGKKLGHGIGDTASNQGGEKHTGEGFPEGGVEEGVAGADLENSDEDDDFENGAEGLGEAETFCAPIEEVEEDGKADSGADGEDRDDEGGASVLLRVETARGDVENATGENRENEGGEDIRNELVAAVFDEVDDVATGEEGNRGNGEGNPDNRAEGGAEGVVEFGFVPFSDLFGELGEEGGRNRDADERDGHILERGGLVETAESAGAHAGGKVGVDDAVNIVDTLVEGTGGEEFQNVAEATVFPVDFEFVIKAETKKPDEGDENFENGAKNDAEGDTHDTTVEKMEAEEVDAVGEASDANQDADVVERGGESVEDEAADGLLDGGEDGGDGHEEGVNRNHAHHVNRENRAGFVETWADDIANQRVGKNHNQDASDERDDGENVEQTGRKLPRGSFVAGDKTLVEHGNKGDGESTRSQNEEHEVGNREGSGVGVDAGGVGVEIVGVEKAVAKDAEERRNEGATRKNDGGGFDREPHVGEGNHRTELKTLHRIYYSKKNRKRAKKALVELCFGGESGGF